MHALNEQARTIVDLSANAGMSVRLIQPQEEDRLLSALTSAFAKDPPSRWLYPEPEAYQRWFPVFARAFGGGALELGTAWRTQDFLAYALWFPPGTAPEEDALISVIESSVPPHRHADVFAVFEAMGEAHPTVPHWYLPLIGVDAAGQGSGRGAALLRETLAVCDRDGMPAYLEASSPRSIPLYERFGFRCRESLQVGSCPPITPMWRPATRLRGL